MTTTSIGLDIGSTAVRAVAVRSGNRGPVVLERVGHVPLPPGAVRDGEITQPDAVISALRTLWSVSKFSQRKVSLGLANQQVVVRPVDLPWLPPDELRRSLPFQVADQIPIPVDQAILDYHPLGRYESDDGIPMVRVLLVAAARPMVEQVVAVARAAKLEPVGIDLDAFAMVRSLAVADTAGDGQLVLDVGATVTNVVVLQGGTPRFVRILLMGGDAITGGLVEALGVDWDTAEETKRHTAVADEYGFGAADPAARTVTERAIAFVDEIRGSLDYYRAQRDAVPVTRVVLAGGASRLPNLRERLADTLGLPVESGRPLRDLSVGKARRDPGLLNDAEPHLAVAVGLALAGAA